jgi:hypothetical protein
MLAGHRLQCQQRIAPGASEAPQPLEVARRSEAVRGPLRDPRTD